MFLTFSKMLKSMGGVHIGAGFRLTKKNAWWALIALLFIGMLQLAWWSVVLCFWMIYGMVWCVCKPISMIAKSFTKNK
jgi:hypothetical protein